jgi:outer membrane protein assembly factor BamB
MLKQLIKGGAIATVGLVAVGAVLYQFYGLRPVLDGGGSPRLDFVTGGEQQAEEIARHREAQRREEAVMLAADQPAASAGDALAPVETRVAPAPEATAPDTPYWTDFRGPRRDGHYRERPIPTDWPSAGLTPMWKQPIGGGYASFVVAAGRAFTIEQRAQQEVVAAYEVETGRELWTSSWEALFRESLGGDGPRATPTWAEGVVYALGGTGELRALSDTDGRVIWQANILDDNGARNLDWGMAASPLVVDDTLVVLPGGPNGRSVVAYDRRTGAKAWSTLDDQQAYSSPMLVTLAGVRQILVFSAARLMGLSPDRGDVLWEYPWRTDFGINAGQPIVLGEDRVFLSSGYGTGAAVIEVRATGSRFSVREVWRNNRMKNQFTSSVVHEGFVYGLDESILACMDAATGELQWKGGRYGYGHVLLASGHLIVLAENGDLALVRATPEQHEEIVRFPALSGKTWNHPAMAGGFLLIRNLAEMAAYDLR